MDTSIKIEKQVAGADEARSGAELSNFLPEYRQSKIKAALSEHVKKFPDVFKVIYEPKLPQRDDL